MVEEVQEAILGSRASKLRRILPVRRYDTGSRPGLRGDYPKGAARGDQE